MRIINGGADDFVRSRTAPFVRSRLGVFVRSEPALEPTRLEIQLVDIGLSLSAALNRKQAVGFQ